MVLYLLMRRTLAVCDQLECGIGATSHVAKNCVAIYVAPMGSHAYLLKL